MSINIEEVSCEIIVHAGNAKANAYDALRCVKKGDYDAANDLLVLADEDVVKSHKIHLRLLGLKEAFKSVNEQLLVTHAMDTLMTTMSEINLIKELIDLYQRKEGENGK